MSNQKTETSEIEKKLLLNLKSILSSLYPNGTISGREFCIGNVEGEKGDSLKINTTTGVWSDFAESEAKGRILGFFAYRNGSFPKGMEEVRQLLKLPRAVITKFKKPKVTWSDTFEKRAEPISYLVHERGIPSKVLRLCGVRHDEESYVFTGEDESGVLCYAQFTKLERVDGHKSIRFSPSGYKPVLWGMHSMPELNSNGNVVITEGVIDALTYRSVGIFAVSIPSGISDSRWVDHCWDWLSQFNNIYLSVDYDGAGQEEIGKIAGRLGTHRCKKVILPEKDANDTLKSCGGLEELKPILLKCLDEAKDVTPTKHLSVTEVREHVWEKVKEGPIELQGDPFLGWMYKREGNAMLDPVDFRFRPSEQTIWTGYPGSGKTTALYQHVSHSIFVLNQSAAIAALEEPYYKTILTMIKQALGYFPEADQRDWFDWAFDRISSKLHVYSELGRTPISEVLDFFEYCSKRHGVNHCILDSLMKTDIDIDGDKAEVAKMITSVIDSTNKSSAHYHIVAHAAKGNDEDWSEMPTLSKVKGIQEVTANAHNVIAVWRCKPKEAAIANAIAKNQLEEAAKKYAERGDTIFKICKNRNGGQLGQIHGWFSKKSDRFRPLPEPERKPNYIPED